MFKQLTVGDADRQWAMQVPAAHDGEKPIPLWILTTADICAHLIPTMQERSAVRMDAILSMG